jgi:DNA-binding protein
MIEEKKQIDEGSKVVENNSENEDIDSSEESEVVEKEKSVEIMKEGKDNIIYIGIKPFMNYVTGIVMQFQNKGQDEVIVSARGKFISKAVDAVEVARRTFLKDEDIKIENIGINSEQFENKEGKRIFVSTIEIKLVKN